MTWRELLILDHEYVTLPWTGARELRSADRIWTIVGKLPFEHGWYVFEIMRGRSATLTTHIAMPPELKYVVSGYLIGDRLVTDDTIHRVVTNLETAARQLPKVHLIGAGLDRFEHVSAGRIYANGPLIYRSREMPRGPEDAVLRAYEDRRPGLDHIKGVTPGLDAAFRVENLQRVLIEQRRAELERLHAEEEARRVIEERRDQIRRTLGDGALRRQLAKTDFESAARAALATASAELLDYRSSMHRGEWIVRYRLDGRRLECICDTNLRIIDSGICMEDHRTGVKGDANFTLESLPGAIRYAERNDVLVVRRHA